MSRLDELFDHLDGFEARPVERWHPDNVLDIGLAIDHRGSWLYRDSPIERQRLIKLFASVLRRENESEFFLVTPNVKYPISVACTPFVATDLVVRQRGEDQELVFRSNVDEVAVAGASHPLTVVSCDERKVPSVVMRSDLQARLSRSVYYRLAEYAQEHDVDGNARHGVWSGGLFWPLDLD